MQALERVSSGPARVLAGSLGPMQDGCGKLTVGALADVCIFDPQAMGSVEPAALRSRGRHTPFEGHSLPGRVRWTLVGGQIAYEG
jgi:dihydroorotase